MNIVSPRYCELSVAFPAEFFTISLQYKNANIANFVLALLLKINQSNAAFDLKM